MVTFQEHNPEEASQVEPTIEEIKKFDKNKLLEWIQRKRPGLLEDDNLETFKKAFIRGNVFVKYGCDVGFFEDGCHLPFGISCELVELAVEITGGETAGTVQKGKEQDTSIDPAMRKRKSPPHTDMAPSPKRTRLGNSSMRINGQLEFFQSGLDEDFSKLLWREGQAYFDRTGYIFKLHKLSTSILFCRPRRFGKSLTVSMLKHFHGLQYADEHQSLYEGLDVQNDIDKGNVKPGQYFVLAFDFSEVRPNTDLTEANETLIKFLNSSLEAFYETYATYLGRDVTDLHRTIDSKEPNVSLRRCAQSVQRAIRQGGRLAGIEGIYVLVDEYDAFPNNYLELLQTADEPKTAWENTTVGYTFKSFWSTIKSLGGEFIRRVFITGISPLSLSSVGSSFNVLTNLSFDKDLASLCGLTHSDLEDALKQMNKEPAECSRILSDMTESFNGYHFCNDETVNTVYNTETCLANLQRLIQGKTPNLEDPENSEISEQFLRGLASSAPAIRDFEKATKFDENGKFTPLKYDEFKTQLTLRDLSVSGNHAAWTSLIVYFGGLTFHPDKPTSHLKIPNNVAAKRIARAVLEKYDLRSSWKEALQCLIDDGEVEGTLRVYRGWMVQRDVTDHDLSKKDEASHRDSFCSNLLENPFLVPRPEFQVIKKDNTNGRVDLVLQVRNRLIVTEWKFYRIPYLNVRVGDRDDANDFAKAATLYNYELTEILELRWSNKERFKGGTLNSWITGNNVRQLRDYVTSPTVKQLLEERGLELRAHLVIIVGSRHILLWDMDKKGTLATRPRLVEMPSRFIRQNG